MDTYIYSSKNVFRNKPPFLINIVLKAKTNHDKLTGTIPIKRFITTTRCIDNSMERDRSLLSNETRLFQSRVFGPLRSNRSGRAAA